MSISLVGGPKDDVFVGRQAELSALLEVMARVEEGQPWLVTVEGGSGIGKTALVKRGLASARGFRALSARSDQSETDLEYGVIEQLLRNVDVPLLDRYPLLRGDVVRSSAFAVGAELLAVLGEQLATGQLRWSSTTSNGPTARRSTPFRSCSGACPSSRSSSCSSAAEIATTWTRPRGACCSGWTNECT